MKKLSKMLVIMTLITLALVPLTVVKPVHAQMAAIWLNPVRKNYTDSFLGYVSYAYKRGTNATLVIKIHNQYSKAYLFTALVDTDWLTQNVTFITDQKIPKGETYALEKNIQIPSTVSYLYPHTYTIYVYYREAITDASVIYQSITDNNFAVYTQEQSEANTLWLELDQYPAAPYYIPIIGSSAEFRELMINASLETKMGDQSYGKGDFTGARDHYKTALDNTRDAFASDAHYFASFEDAVVAIVNAGQTYLSFQGWAFFVASLGFLLMGIGVIVYLVRKSGRPVT